MSCSRCTLLAKLANRVSSGRASLIKIAGWKLLTVFADFYFPLEDELYHCGVHKRIFGILFKPNDCLSI